MGMLALAATAFAPARPLLAAGFSIYEQSAKATGMADAVTAQSDDPSAIFYNPGGVAFFERAAGSVGDTYITETRADFRGANPFPGDGANGVEHRLQAFPPHAYWVQPITSQFKVGLGIESPFGLVTQWNNPDNFSGRFLSTRAAILDVDINPTIAWQVTPELGIGIGGIARVSKVELERDAPAVDPFTFDTVNAAKVKLSSNNDEGYGFDLGFLHKPTSWLSWGASYRSKITVDYSGGAVLFPRPTGDPAFDAVLAQQLPFNTSIPVKTQIKFPDQASLGFAFKVMPALTVELDGNYFGWSDFNTVQITFPGGQLPNTTVLERWKRSYAGRIGLNWASSAQWQWRAGYVYDQTPQPEQTVNPLLPDANRNGVTVGAGYIGQHLNVDLGIMYLFFADRTRTSTFVGDQQGDFFGTYSTRALLVSLTLGFHQ